MGLKAIASLKETGEEGENKMIEMSLKQYREECEKLSFPADLKTAGILAIPDNALFKEKGSDAEKDAIIDKGANILRQTSPWLFFRYSWIKYSFLSKEDPNDVKKTIKSLIEQESQAEPIMQMWKVFVLPIEETKEISLSLIERIGWDLQGMLSDFESTVYR